MLLLQLVGITEKTHQKTSSDISTVGQNMKRGSSNRK